MSIPWPSGLVEAIARRRAVILIGSGVSANATTVAGDSPPTWGQFLLKAYDALNRRVPHIKKAIERYAYLEACEYLKAEYNVRWVDMVKGAFGVPQYKPGEIHKAIFDLDCRIIASLNFDKIFENYAISASEDTVVIKYYYDDDIRQIVAGTDRYIVKPHGTIDSASRLIFTLAEYANARVRYSQFYELMNALLHTHTFFCIG